METLRKWQVGVDREANKSAWKPRNGRRWDSFKGLFQYCRKSSSDSFVKFREFITEEYRRIHILWVLIRVTSKPLSTKLFFSFLHSRGGLTFIPYHCFLHQQILCRQNKPPPRSKTRLYCTPGSLTSTGGIITRGAAWNQIKWRLANSLYILKVQLGIIRLCQFLLFILFFVFVLWDFWETTL